MSAAFTAGPWKFACDSYGKVQHSRKACVYTTKREPGGEMLVTIAARIPEWSDARLIAAAPELYDNGQFLCERLRDLEGYDGDELLRQLMGHVLPALARMESTLAEARGESA